MTDLPGTYALSAYTPEERYVRSHIAERTPDVIINSVVASNLERNLYLTTELIDINPRMVVALNMFDELNSSGAELDYDNLGRMLGVPMVPVEARNGKGIEQLLDTVIAVYENQDERVRHIHINMGSVIEEGLRRLNGEMNAFRGELPKAFPPRYYAMKMLEGDRSRSSCAAAATGPNGPRSAIWKPSASAKRWAKTSKRRSPTRNTDSYRARSGRPSLRASARRLRPRR